LRCHDVHAELRNVDPDSGTLTPLADTRMIGLAASLASLVRGQDVVADAIALKAIVAEQLDIGPYAFGGVIETLSERTWWTTSSGVATKSLDSQKMCPFIRTSTAGLGTWRDGEPSQFEEEMLAIVDRLALTPLPSEELENELGLDRGDIPRLIEVGKASDLVKGVSLRR
jgi:hypothetical protein